MGEINVYIADNQALTKVGIITILKGHFNQQMVVNEFANKEELFEQLKKGQPHLLIIDFDFFDFNDISEIAQIKNLAPETGVLIVTDNQSSDTISKVVNLGISNYILKTSTEQELIEGVQATLNNKKFFSSSVLDILIEQRTKPKILNETGKLTISEIEIVKLISQGLTTKEIASQKFLSFHTIITHRKNIFRKLAINNTSELMMYAMRAGIIDNLEYYI